MKFKGLTKIALAGVAVAATAATLATSTYAWYVTNDTATVDGLTGSVAAVGGGNILIAEAKNSANGDLPGGFSTGFTIKSTNVIAPWKVTKNASNKYEKESTGLIPVTPGTYVAEQDNSGTITPAALTADATLSHWVNDKGQAITTPEFTDEDNATAGEARYIEFKLWLMSTEDVAQATLKLNLHNSTANLPTQQAYNDAGVSADDNGLRTGRTIALNALEAVRIAYTEDDTVFTAVANPDANDIGTYYEVSTTVNDYVLTTDTAVQSGKTYYTKTTNAASYNIFDAYAQAETKTSVLTFNDSTGFDANTYYYAIMNKIPVGAAYTASVNNNVRTDTITKYSVDAPAKKLPKKGSAASTDQVVLSLTANIAKKLTFRVWLEGTDAQCFDCCTGQTFDFSLEFSK